LKDFFESGARLAWIIDLEAQRVEVCYSLTRRQLMGAGGYLEGEELLPGFRSPIAELFQPGDWE
jgi:hypothetical protein